MSAWVERYGPWAIIAGASEGLGAELARAAARRGLHVALIARRAEVLEALARELRALGVQTRCVTQDLAALDAPERLAAALADLEVGLLIHNAAYAPSGEFLTLTPADHAQSIAVNISTPVGLAHHFGQAMAKRGHGGIILLSSLTAFQGAPFLATYGATKAFNLSLGEALSFELRGRVDVLAACPGATRTPNYLRTSQGAPGELEPKEVAEDALNHLGRRAVTIAGFVNRLAALFMTRVLPRRLAVAIMGAEGRKLLGASSSKAAEPRG